MSNVLSWTQGGDYFARREYIDQIPVTESGLRNAVDEEVEHNHHTTSRGGITGIVPNRDPVIRLVAPAAGSAYMDERVYVEMARTENKLLDARRHLESVIFSHGFQVRRGLSGTPKADDLAEFGKQLWSAIPKKRTVLERIHDSYYWGWRPMQSIVDTATRHKGKLVWAPKKIVDKPPWMVRFTEDDSIVWIPEMGSQATEFTGDEADLGWLTWSIGSLDTPYGEGLYQSAWLLVFAKRRIFKKFAQGLDREMGLFKASNTDSSASIAEVQQELEEIVSFLNNYNILVQAKGWELESITGLNFISGGLDALKYLDAQIMTLVTGQTLTAEAGDRGARSLGDVHAIVVSDYAKDAALQTIEEPITQLLKTFVDVNFGEQDPDDYPIFASDLRRQVSNETIQLFFSMGIPLRVEVLAEQRNATELIATGEDKDEMVVKQEPQLAGFGDPFGALPPQPQPRRLGPAVPELVPGERTASQHSLDFAAVDTEAEDQNQFLDRVSDAAIRSADDAGSSYVQAFAEDFILRHGLVPPKAPRSHSSAKPPSDGSVKD